MGLMSVWVVPLVGVDFLCPLLDNIRDWGIHHLEEDMEVINNHITNTRVLEMADQECIYRSRILVDWEWEEVEEGTVWDCTVQGRTRGKRAEALRDKVPKVLSP